MNRNRIQIAIASLLLIALTLAGCQAVTPANPSAAAPAADAPAANASAATSSDQPAVDLSAIKQYLTTNAATLSEAAQELKVASDAWYADAEANGFDYAALYSADPQKAQAQVEAARAAWIKASPLYEKIEGVVAGTPSLSHYDVDLDAGSAATDDPENAVSFDITLPNGTVLEKPGNLFGVAESTLWGTWDAYRAPVDADFDGDGTVEFGESLPDANVLKGSADLLAQMTSDLVASANEWQPTTSDAFTALVVMVPTMSEYFQSWKDSRFVSGDASVQRDFVAISRLADIQDILGGLEIVYGGVRPLTNGVDTAQAAQIAGDMTGLREFVAGIFAQEQQGTKFTREDADTMGAEAQNRATAITGMIAQMAAQLNVPVEE